MFYVRRFLTLTCVYSLNILVYLLEIIVEMKDNTHSLKEQNSIVEMDSLVK